MIKIKIHAIKGSILENLEKENKIEPLIAWICFWNLENIIYYKNICGNR
jgi:hypothetical protein